MLQGDLRVAKENILMTHSPSWFWDKNEKKNFIWLTKGELFIALEFIECKTGQLLWKVLSSYGILYTTSGGLQYLTEDYNADSG
jgi:hypothetical protein